jgi:hypothetical protein
MPKNKVSEFSSTPANNTDIGGIDIAEGCAPSGINNAIRELMAQLKDQQVGSDADSFTVGGNLIVNGTSTLTGDVTAPTQSGADNSTKVATTAFVQSKVGTLGTMSTQNANAVGITGGTISGLSSALPIASGGTGATTQGAALTNIVGFTPVQQGGVSGQLGNKIYIGWTGSMLTAQVDNTNFGSILGLGSNQTWQSPGRVAGQQYTNNAGRPIQVSIILNSTTGGDFGGELYVNGVLIAKQINYAANAGYKTTLTAIVPAGSTYQMNFHRNASIDSWRELS